MTGPSRRRVVTGALAVVAGLTVAACSADATTTADADVDTGYVSGDGSVQTWPRGERGDVVELAGVTFEDETVDLADWRGDITVLNFWYAECPPCRAEAPDLAQVHEEYSDEGVHLLGVNHTNEPATALAFERRFEVPYPSLYDSDAAGVAALQGVVPLQAMPSTVVIDQDGRVAARVVGRVEASTLSALIDDVLAEAP
ncbi:TlpA family protein disulfide reductase [Ruania alkalisoli]|uniref:TlpA family protein disulfide reductase n=1 Tax=Ruania alkalisoli TaxID=2779775 RepID=A0A7M1SR68_9MICO|nr:TlpA disulfide reductase family protein [Ruania alkalisoli]QOR70046.1 TlpA family protein disulfide reductase [Ruania alkalisoli]